MLRAQTGQSDWTVHAYWHQSDGVQVQGCALAAAKSKEHVAQTDSECDGIRSECMWDPGANLADGRSRDNK